MNCHQHAPLTEKEHSHSWQPSSPLSNSHRCLALLDDQVLTRRNHNPSVQMHRRRGISSLLIQVCCVYLPCRVCTAAFMCAVRMCCIRWPQPLLNVCVCPPHPSDPLVPLDQGSSAPSLLTDGDARPTVTRRRLSRRFSQDGKRWATKQVWMCMCVYVCV